MKKFLPVIIGVFVGISVSTGLLLNAKDRIARGEEGVNWWNSFVAADSDLFDWQDVFTPLGPAEKGRNFYNLVYKKLTREAGKDALQQVAANNGLTVSEARAAVNGSMVPILNNPKYSSTLTQDDAAKIMANLQDNYVQLYQLYQIQQEVEVSIAPGEMFANGDLSDSGFDLVQDLSLIEEILFLEKSPQTVGGVFEDAYGSPYKPTEDDQTLANYIADEADAAFLPLEVEGGGESDSGGSAKVGIISIGDKKIEAEILNEDICKPVNNLAGGLADFEELGGGDGVVGAVGGDDGGEGGGAGSTDDEADESDGESDGGETEDEQKDKAGPDSKTKAAPADDWTKEWCVNYEEPGVFAGIGASGFESLGGVSNNHIYGGNAAANYENNLVSAKIGVCFDIKMVPKKVSSFLAGDTCILCEVEKINEYLDKTLSHTLVPNKVTGNPLESAKCKNSAMIPLINMQFVTIWNPVPTPINDKLIFGNSIYEEWNKFLTRYQPYMVSKPDLDFDIEDRPDLNDDFNIKLQQELAGSSLTQSKLFNDVKRIEAEAAAEANLSLKSVEIGNEVADTMVYSRNVLQEIKQMNALFENFKNTLVKTNEEALEKIINKPNVE